MTTRPSTLRQLLRNSQEFGNCLNPLLEESLPLVSPNTKSKTLFLSSLLIVPKKPDVTRCTFKSNFPKPRVAKPDRKPLTTRIPYKPSKCSQAVGATDENSSPPPTSSIEAKEVYLSYNDSNTPKYVGKFFNVMVGNRLKRQCKYCHLQYADLKGFNRHYEKKHVR
ncbi:hypothetical protein KGF57_003962 [Candida theae]|uniref:C2H2-type domain-containing protein n=1 Tax=Candida theae TaxID=1198502 RepID=A0AAD5BCI5_9ASCO|nr:uncharacterized protein KGF57_003962 [Candida theae]KAI5953753.1 hypothetical protein KGF57_003962 [Candida theae]